MPALCVGGFLLAAGLLSVLAPKAAGEASGARRSGRGGTRSIEIAYRTRTSLRTVLARHPARLVRVIPTLHVAEVHPAGETRAFVEAVRREPGVASVRETASRAAAGSPALALGLLSTPDGGAYEWQYYAAGVDRVPASVFTAARSVTIAVLDTGVDRSSPDLEGKAVGAYDVRSGSAAVADESGHGTFVASLAAGSGVGVSGFGGDARLLVVKVADTTTFDDVDVAAGILYAVRHGAKIVNLSVAGRTRSPAEERAVRYAARHGVLLVAAAGNDALNGDPPEYPAALLQPVGSNGAGGIGLAVGASDTQGRRAPFSEHGSFVSLVAPGENVFGAVSSRASVAEFPRSPLGGAGGAELYGFASGTSFAAPQVAGAAALVWAADPALSAREVAGLLEQTASAHGVWTPALGYGVLDVGAAVHAALLQSR